MIAPGRSEVGDSDLFREFKVYTLECPQEEDTLDGEAVAVCLIVLRRMGGLLLAISHGYFTAEQLAAGLASPCPDRAGRTCFKFGEHSTARSCTGCPEFSLLWIPIEFLHLFDNGNPLTLPLVEPLVEAAWQWVQDPGAGERELPSNEHTKTRSTKCQRHALHLSEEAGQEFSMALATTGLGEREGLVQQWPLWLLSSSS